MMSSLSVDAIDMALHDFDFDLEDRIAILKYMTPFEHVYAKKGELLYRYNQPVHRVYLIIDGLLRSYSYVGNQEVNLRFLASPALAIPFKILAEQMLCSDQGKTKTRTTGQ